MDGQVAVEAEKIGNVRTVAISGPSNHLGTTLAQMTTSAEEGELAALRRFAATSSNLNWETNSQGVITWANAAYVDMVQALDEEVDQPTWPLPSIFGPIDDTSDGAVHRFDLALPGVVEDASFEILVTRFGPVAAYQAQPVDRLLRAERSLTEFVQSLSQTFAHLPTGLAIFNRDRSLIVFNPALTDLSDIDPGFLTSRPSLTAFLDKLREKQRIPEPKDYKSWRTRMSNLEEEAASGTYQETWDLPGSYTLRVTGKPHPGGAIALLFEDISTEITHARRFRARLATCQSVLDSLNHGAAVFSNTGALLLTNRVYRETWAGTKSKRGSDITEASRCWADLCRPSPIWADARDFICAEGERSEWEADVRLASGSLVQVRFVPIVGRASLVLFDPPRTSQQLSDAGRNVVAF